MDLYEFLINKWEELAKADSSSMIGIPQSPAGCFVGYRKGLLAPAISLCITAEHARGIQREDLRNIKFEVVEAGDDKIILNFLLKNSIYKEQFAAIGIDILSTLKGAKSEKEKARIFRLKFDYWKSLFEKEKENRLSEQILLGLYGELSLIDELLSLGISPEELMHGWIGPFGDNQDFHLNGYALEVKSTSSNDGNIIKISNIKQLDETGFKSLFLSHFIFTKIKNASQGTIKHLIQKISDKIPTPSTRLIFQSKLNIYGYFKEDEDFYTTGYDLRNVKSYDVNNQFPRLKECDLPTRISGTSYNIDLAGFDSNEISFQNIIMKLQDE